MTRDRLYRFVTCPVRAENIVKSAMVEQLAGCRPAFARPGLLTFRVDSAADPAAPRPHPLARCWGISLGSPKTIDEVHTQLRSLSERPCLQVFAGEPGPLGHVPDEVANRWDERVAEVERELVQCYQDELFLRRPHLGEAVLDVIVRPDEPLFVGWHRHTDTRGPLAGGRFPLPDTRDAPSRAWQKLEELVAWSGASLRAGDVVLELGCSPGGATVALLDRGLRVVGVDPQEMSLPERLRGAPFTHHRAPIEALARDTLPDGVHWIVVDLSVAAPVALHTLQRLIPRYRKRGPNGDGLLGVLLTLKLNEWSLVQRASEWITHLSQMGLHPSGPAHLPAYRQEVAMAAFTDRGIARKR